MNRVTKLRLILAFLAVVGVPAWASASTIYLNEATFIANAGALGFESFEGLAASNSVSAGFSRSLAAFTITGTPQGGVFDLADYLGTHATDGAKFIEFESGNQQTVTFTFSSPIHEFAVTITDYGDFTASPLTFVTNGGGSGSAALGTQPNGTDQFFGFIDAANPFTTITLATGVGQFGDPFSVDRVRFSAPQANPSPVPEPASLLLVGTGLVAALRRRIKG